MDSLLLPLSFNTYYYNNELPGTKRVVKSSRLQTRSLYYIGTVVRLVLTRNIIAARTSKSVHQMALF